MLRAHMRPIAVYLSDYPPTTFLIVDKITKFEGAAVVGGFADVAFHG